MNETNDLWLFVEHGEFGTWTRANVPHGITTVRDMLSYIQRGGRVLSDWMDIQPSARFIPRVAGMTVLARLVE